MEKKLFSWEGWDQLYTVDFLFHNCVLNRQIGPFKIGTKVDCIGLSYETGLMSLYLKDDGSASPDYLCQLELVVKEEGK